MSRSYSKVSDEQVREIRSRYEEGSIGIVALAAAYGVSKSLIVERASAEALCLQLWGSPETNLT
jgi:hypothetical protein